jgi:serine/threonine-protein kinase
MGHWIGIASSDALTQTSVPAALSTESADSQQAVYWIQSASPRGGNMKRIHTLGGLAILGGTRPLGGHAQQPRRLALLAVLARAGEHGVSRDRLVTLLWGEVEPERARRNLNQALYAVRQDLGSEDAILGTHDLRLNPELVEADVIDFQTASASGALEEAARLYAGPFLGDFNLPGVRDFARWAEEERERLAVEYRGILEALAADAKRRGDPAGAVLWWRRLAALDPMNAATARGLMRALAAAGDAPGAFRHAEIFSALRQEELELPPDPEVQALAEQIRRGELAPVPAMGAERSGLPPATSSPIPPQPRSIEPATHPDVLVSLAQTGSNRKWLTLTLSAIALAAVAAGLLRARARAVPKLRPSVVVVAPFDVYGSKLGLWHEGLVDLLSRNLDGAGPLSTVPPTVVVRNWSGRADSPSAAELARRTGAGLALYGSLLRSGADSVRLRATLLDVASGRTLQEWEVVDATDRIDRLVDSLSIRVLTGLGHTHAIGGPIKGFRGSGLPVLKAFLQGEQQYRRSEWDSALVYYQRAIELDSTFAPALRRASTTLAWRNRAHTPQVLEYAARAAANNHGWAPRDSLLIAVESEFFALMGSSMVSGVDPRWSSRVHRLFNDSELLTDRYPDDPEAWHDLGEAYNHFGNFVGGSYEQQLRAFDRAIALDSAFSPAYIHPIEVSSAFGPDLMRRYLRPYLALTQGDPGAESARLIQRLLDSAPAVTDRAALFKGFSDQSLLIAPFVLGRLADSAERIVDLARFVFDREDKTAMPGMGGMMDEASMARHQLVRALMSRGHLEAALKLLRDQEPASFRGFAEAALLGAIPVQQAETVFRERPSQPFQPAFMARFPWWAFQRDTASLRRVSAWSDSLVRSSRDDNVRAASTYVSASALAYAALARRDTTTAIARLSALPEGGCATCYLDQLTLAQLLAARHSDRQAWRILQADGASGAVVPLPGEVLWVLLRGRVAERLGLRNRAVQSYSWVADMWRNADPELQGYALEARNGRARLMVGH